MNGLRVRERRVMADPSYAAFADRMTANPQCWLNRVDAEQYLQAVRDRANRTRVARHRRILDGTARLIVQRIGMFDLRNGRK